MKITVEKMTKKPINFSTAPFNDYKPPPKRTTQKIPMRFGFKQVGAKTTITTTTPLPAPMFERQTPKPTSKPKSFHIKTPRTTTTPRPVPRPAPSTKPVPQKLKKPTKWYQNVNYEPKPSNTDLTHTKANKCDSMYCRLPDCRCGGIHIPGI